MSLAGSADGPQTGPKASDAPEPRAPTLSVRYESVVNVAVWTFVACGAIALVEPSPYDFASFVAIPLWLLGGATIHRSFLPFLFLLLFQALVGFFALLPYWSDPDSVLYQYQTAYLTLTGLFFALYVGERTEARAELILKAYTVGAFVAAVTGVVGYFDLAGLGETFSRYGRASGTFKDPNVLGSFVILSAVYLMQNLLLARARSAAFTATILAVIVAGVFLSFSRGSWGAAIFSIIFMIAAAFATSEAAGSRRRIAVIAIVAAILIVAVVAVLLSFDETRDFFLKRAALTQDYDEGETGRFGNQMRSLPMLLERFGGFGPLRFRLIFGLEPHNSYIGAFANGGWLGGLLFVLIVGITTFIGLRLMFKRSPYQRLAQVYFPTLTAFFLQAFQIDIDHWRHVFLMLGVVWGLEAGRQKWLPRRGSTSADHVKDEARTCAPRVNPFAPVRGRASRP
jgi:O-antigen ligase